MSEDDACPHECREDAHGTRLPLACCHNPLRRWSTRSAGPLRLPRGPLRLLCKFCARSLCRAAATGRIDARALGASPPQDRPTDARTDTVLMCAGSAAGEVVACSRLKTKAMVASTPSGTRRGGAKRCAHGASCAWCGLAVEDVSKASGLTGKKDDPVFFPRCRHALHANCLRAWEYDGSGPEQRALLDKRRASQYLKDLCGLASASYDHRYGGACRLCVPSPTASLASGGCEPASSDQSSATNVAS